MKRREFIGTAAFATVAALSMPSMLYAGKRKKTVGIQLYTLRDTIVNNPKADLDKIASFGYKKIETFGYADGKIFGMPVAEFGKYVKGLNMKVVSGHYGLDLIKSDAWEKTLSDAKMLGQEYVVLPWLADSERTSIDNYKRICEVLNKAGEKSKSYGLRMGYHNHAFEFDTVDNQIPYDVMLAELDASNVSMEMDIFWVVNAGKNPLDYFAKYPGRFEQWHVKDMDKSDRMKNANIGAGSIDWKAIFANAKLSGMKHFYVEQESYPGAPIDSVHSSIKYLRTIL
jgi:sugar phosphate isomerase/epimerase